MRRCKIMLIEFFIFVHITIFFPILIPGRILFPTKKKKRNIIQLSVYF